MNFRLIGVVFFCLFPFKAFAHGGLSGLSIIVDFLFWISALVFIGFILASFVTNAKKRQKQQKTDLYLVTKIFLGIYSPVYLLLTPIVSGISSSQLAIFQWLIPLHLFLTSSIFYFYTDTFKSKIKLTLITVLLIGLSFVASQGVNFYYYVPVENQTLSNPQEVLMDYKNDIIELESGFYRKRELSYRVSTGDVIELIPNGQRYNVYKMYEKGMAFPKFMLINKSRYFFNFPWFRKEYSRYQREQVIGSLERLDDNVDFKVASDALLHFKCRKLCSLRELKALVEKGADVNVQYLNGNSILHSIVHAGTIDHVRYLLSKGAKINVVGGKYLPINYALNNKKYGLDIIKLLLKKGATINARFISDVEALPESKRKEEIKILISNIKHS